MTEIHPTPAQESQAQKELEERDGKASAGAIRITENPVEKTGRLIS